MGERVKDKVVIVTGAGSIGPGWGNGKAAAVLYAREGSKVLAAELQQYARTRMAEYKRPRWVSLVAELPKTATGKIQRFKLA